MKNAVVWILYFICCSGIYLSSDKKSTVDFVIDKFEYHAMGVNMAYGHGIQKVGMLEHFDKYNFTISEIPDNEALINRPILVHFFTKMSNQFHFFREPLYSIFLGCIYGVFGVSTYAVYIIQLSMLLISAFLIYDLSKTFSLNRWRSFIGFVAGLIYIYIFKNLPFEILPETYFLFLFTLLIWVFIKLKDATGPLKIFSISLLLALIYLGKPYIVFFVPLLFIKSVLYFAYNKKWSEDIWIVICFFLLIAPYNIYSNLRDNKQHVSKEQFNEIVFADNNKIYQKGNIQVKEYLDLNPVVNYEHLDDTSKIFFHFFEASYVTNKLFFITKRPGGILLDTHNYNISTDGKIFDWRINPNHFYNSSTVKPYHDIVKVMLFYKEYPLFFFKILSLKIYAAFVNLSLFWFIGFLVILIKKPFANFANLLLSALFLIATIFSYDICSFNVVFLFAVLPFAFFNIFLLSREILKINQHVLLVWVSFLILFFIIAGWARFSIFTNIFYILLLFNLFKSELYSQESNKDLS